MLVKNLLNLLAISFVSFIIVSLSSLKYSWNDVFLSSLFNIDLMVFHVFFHVIFEGVKAWSIISCFSIMDWFA